MKKYDIYQLENDFNYSCDTVDRQNHINILNRMKTREQQEEYMVYFNIQSK